jgi:hypothetical protein
MKESTKKVGILAISFNAILLAPSSEVCIYLEHEMGR